MFVDFGKAQAGALYVCGCGSKPVESHFGVGAPPVLVYFSGDWDVHWGYGIFTHGHVKTQVQMPER